MLKTFILRNDNAEKLLTCWQKNNCPTNNQVTYTFLCQMNLLFFKNLKEFFFISSNQFSGIWTNNFTVIVLIFFSKNGVFKNVKKMEKVRVGSEKSIDSFEIKKGEVAWLFIGQCFFLNKFLITFRHFCYARWIFLTSLIWIIVFSDLLHSDISKFWSNQIFVCTSVTR